MIQIIITLIITIGVAFIVFIIAVYNKNLPKNVCNHDMETIVARNGNASKEYLSTCSKCGYQRTHKFYGTNLS